MKSHKSPLTHCPFEDIRSLLGSRILLFPDHRNSGLSKDGEEESPEPDEKLFMEAMEGVTPIERDNHVEKVPQVTLPEGGKVREDAEALAKLESLVKHGEGFNVSDTPEYVEGTGYNVHPEVARRLHRGEYSMQAYLDLHGLTAEDAKETFEKFLKWAVTTNKTGLLIIHGRGLSSPSEPVLKHKVIEWLTRGLYRKWVVAYSSARICDGGAGATYVLLRHRPLSKRMKIGKTKRR
jgi:DNA-nicking Smr family endonuclease